MKFNYTSPVTDILHTWMLDVLCISDENTTVVVGEEERDEWED